MKAALFRQHGGPEVIEYTEIDTPSPGPGEVLVKVLACGLNRLDLALRNGIKDKLPMPHIGGCEVVGTVSECGPGVDVKWLSKRVLVMPGLGDESSLATLSGNDSFDPNYQVLGFQRQGGFAEYCCVPARALIAISDRWSAAEWAATPLVFQTAWHMLVGRAGLKPGESVLVHGAGSGIGSAAIQICRYLQCPCITTSSSDDKLSRAKTLGATETINYKSHPDFHKEVRRLTNGRGVDVVFEHIGKDTFQSSLASLGIGGRLVFCGVTTGHDVQIDLRFIFVRQLSILGSYMGANHELYRCIELLEQGALQPIVDRVYPLSDLQEAHRHLETRDVFGKIVVTNDKA